MDAVEETQDARRAADKLPAWWAAVAKLPNSWPLYFQMQLLRARARRSTCCCGADRISFTAGRPITLPDTDTKSKRD